MPIFCPRCSAQNQDWAQACYKCASPLSAGASQAPNPQTQTPPGYSSQPQQPYQGYQQQSPSAYAPPAYGGYQQQMEGNWGATSMGNYGSVGKRIAATLLDGVIASVAAIPGIVLIVIGAIMSGSSSSGGGIGTIFFLLGYLLVFVGALGVGLYNIYLLGSTGATLGKRWMGLKVFDNNGQPLGFGKAFLRELVKNLVGNVCFILLLWPLWDKEKQGLHDKVFNTHVYES